LTRLPWTKLSKWKFLPYICSLFSYQILHYSPKYCTIFLCQGRNWPQILPYFLLESERERWDSQKSCTSCLGCNYP
jgi:hypothetical protein